MSSVPSTGASLTLEEARERAVTVAVDSTVIELDLSHPGERFTSTSTINFTASPGASTFLDFKGDSLTSVELNGAALDPRGWRSGRIPLTDLAERNTVRVAGAMAYSSDGEGMHRHIDPADGKTYLYAMSFLDAAPRWFACFDQPDLKSGYRLLVSAPLDWAVLGNGPSEMTEPGRWQITPLAPLSTYFVTLVAGPYASVHDEHDGIRLGLHVRASLAEYLEAEAADLLEVTTAAFDYYHRAFGVRYPFGEYHQVFVPDFNAGAMENPGCVTLRDSYIYRARATAADRGSRAGTVAHEMAHMWFGDLVTMRWWDDLWLNESFAEYIAHRCCSEATRYPLWTEFGIVRKDWGSVADQSPSTHPVAGTGARDASSALSDFDGISYAKGAAVLKQLVAYLGEEVFFAGLRDYFGRHGYGNAAFADLIGAWTRAGATGLDRWSDAWLRTSGMDTLEVSGATLTRRPHADVQRPHAVEVGFLDADGRELGRQTVTVAERPVALELPEQLGRPRRPGLVVPDAGDDSWAKIRLGPGGWDRLPSLLPGIERQDTRVVLINAVRDAVRDAELDPTVAWEVIRGGLRTEPAVIVVGSLLRYALDQISGPYSAVPDRAARVAEVHRTATGLLTAAPPGSDAQLAAFRAVVPSSADPDTLLGWLSGGGLPEGLSMDPELAWLVVIRLAVLTGDAALIERQLAVDPSAAARVHAAQARAALPLESAKTAAWRSLMQPSELSAYELYATAQGFFQPSQNQLCQPYVGRYFAEVGATAGFRTGWALGQVALHAYPASHATPETVAMADQCLDRSDLAPAVRRSVVDGTDRLRRAVRSLERFGGG